jgi:hypothetical protein
MNWIECDWINYSGFDKLRLFRSDDAQFLSFVMDVGLTQVSSVANGNYIHIWLKDAEIYYFAVSVSDKAGVQPFKIYSAKEYPHLAVKNPV